MYFQLEHSQRVAQAVCGGGGRGRGRGEAQVNEIHVLRGYHFRARRPLGSGPGALPTRPVSSSGLARLCPGALSTLEVHSTLLDLDPFIHTDESLSQLVSRDSNSKTRNHPSSSNLKVQSLDRNSCTDTATFSVLTDTGPNGASRAWIYTSAAAACGPVDLILLSSSHVHVHVR